jgi:hypothetical protein
MHVRPSPTAMLYRSLKKNSDQADRPVSGLTSELSLLRVTFPRAQFELRWRSG